MLLPSFDYHRPASMAEALEILSANQGEAKALAGGTDLLVNMKNKRESCSQLVDLGLLEELQGLDNGGGSIRLGSGITAGVLAGGPAALSGFTALIQGAASLGSPQIRNRATLGGNICSARSAADLIPPLLVMGASLIIQGPDGERRVSLDDFLLGASQTVLKADELLTSIEVQAPAPGGGSGFGKLGLRRAMEIARVNAAASLTLDEDGQTIQSAQVALGAVGARAVLSPHAQKALVGEKASEEVFARAGEAAVEDASPRTCHEFKCEVAAVLTRRCLMQSWEQARGGSAS